MRSRKRSPNVKSSPIRPKELLVKTLIAILLGMSVISLTACNTVAGAGKDVQATGKAVEKAADESKPK